MPLMNKSADWPPDYLGLEVQMLNSLQSLPCLIGLLMKVPRLCPQISWAPRVNE